MLSHNQRCPIRFEKRRDFNTIDDSHNVSFATYNTLDYWVGLNFFEAFFKDDLPIEIRTFRLSFRGLIHVGLRTYFVCIAKMEQPRSERDPRITEEIFNKATSGMMLIGTNGVVMDTEAYCGNPQIYPKELFDDTKKSVESGTIKKTETRSPKPGNPQLEWAHCIVNGLAPSSHFDYAVPLTEFVALGNLAIRGGQSIQWDSAAMRVTNGEAANRYVKRTEYRAGWV